MRLALSICDEYDKIDSKKQKGSEEMNLAAIGVPGLIIILVMILILFGPRKLPEVGSAVGKTLAEFKKSTREIMEDGEESTYKTEKQPEPDTEK